MNRRITIITYYIISFLLFLTSITGWAQGKGSWSIEAAIGGYRLFNGPEYSVGADIVRLYKLPFVDIGGGLGIVFSNSVRFDWKGPSLGFSPYWPEESIYSKEVILPLFLRAKTNQWERCFDLIDAGYSFNVHHVAKEIPVGYPDMITYKDYDGSYKTSGLFIEPQIGRNFGNDLFISLGVMLQNTKYIKCWEKRGENNNPIYCTKVQKALSPSLRLHLGYSF